MAKYCYVCKEKIGFMASKAPLMNHHRTNKSNPHQWELSKIIPEEVLCGNCIIALGILDKDSMMDKIQENEKKKYIEHVKANYENCENEDVQIFWETKIIEYEGGISKVYEDRLQYRKDVKLHKELNKYASFEGKQKMIAMLNDKMEVLTAKLNGQTVDADKFYQNVKQPEISWAVMGGIADGIAGPVAGVVTALNVQEKNETIRKENQQWMDVAVASNLLNIEQKTKIKNEIEEIKKKLEKIEIATTVEISSEEVINKLDIQDIQVTDSCRGTIYISAHVIPKGNRSAEELYIDGHFKALVYDSKEQRIGESILTLPLDGARYSTKVEGILLDVPIENKPFTVKIAPYKLWLMEEVNITTDDIFCPSCGVKLSRQYNRKEDMCPVCGEMINMVKE